MRAPKALQLTGRHWVAAPQLRVAGRLSVSSRMVVASTATGGRCFGGTRTAASLVPLRWVA